MSLIVTSNYIGEIYTRNNILQNAIIKILEKYFNVEHYKRRYLNKKIASFVEGSLELEIVNAKLGCNI
jgi:hypothetical protein